MKTRIVIHSFGRKNIGTILIAISILLLFWLYFPVVTLYLPTNLPAQAITDESDFAIHIPKINASSSIQKNIDPWNEVIYKEALKKGVVHARGFSVPGEPGPIFLFAHSSLPPWEMTRTNTPFLRLSELALGDEIVVMYGVKEYKYFVSDKKEVWPDQVSEVINQTGNTLIIQTCTPVGTSLKRLLVYASLRN